MGKMRKFLVLLVFFTSVIFGACDFSGFDKKFNSASKKDKQELHNEVKSTYIKAVINDDKSCKIESLKRLVIASKALGVSSASFEKELAGLGVKVQQNTTQNSKKSENSENSKKTEKSENSKVSENSEKSENSENLNLPRVTKITKDKDEFVVKLNKNLSEKNLKYFTLDHKEAYKNVFDISATLGLKAQAISGSISDKIRIAQSDTNRVRIVFEDDGKSKVLAKIDDDVITFTKAAKQESKKQESKKQEKQENKAEKQEKKVANKEEKEILGIPANVLEKSSASSTNTANNSGKLSKKERSDKIIVLDPGHGGDDVGAKSSNNKLYEKNIVLSVSKKTANILKERGYKVYFTRSNDRFIKLRNRTSFANDKNAHLFISVHANAAPNAAKAKTMKGIETFFLSPSRSERSMDAANLENKADTDEMNYFTKISFLNFLNREKIIASNKLAIDMQSALLKSVRSSYKVSDGGVREAPFWVLVGALMPAVLIEIGYISHPDESLKIANAKYQDKIALGIANGVDEYFAKNR